MPCLHDMYGLWLCGCPVAFMKALPARTGRNGKGPIWQFLFTFHRCDYHS